MIVRTRRVSVLLLSACLLMNCLSASWFYVYATPQSNDAVIGAAHKAVLANDEDAEEDIERMKELIELIKTIDKVTLEHEAMIEEANLLMLRLFGSSIMLSNLELRDLKWYVVSSALRELSYLQTYAASTVDVRISIIGEAGLAAKESRIREARSMYEALTPGSKRYVTKLAELEIAEKQLKVMLAQKAEAEKVDALIAQIGEEISYSSKKAIDAARTAYDALTEEQRMYVTRWKQLEEAEETYKSLFPLWAIILIVAGGVVLMAATVTVTIVVTHKRKAVALQSAETIEAVECDIIEGIPEE